MTLDDLIQEAHNIYMSIEDDGEFCREEFDLVRDFCAERDYELTEEEADYLDTLGYDYTEFSGYQEKEETV